MVLDEDDEDPPPGSTSPRRAPRSRLAIYVVRDPRDVEGIARLGPDPLDDAFTIEVLAQILQDDGRSQIKGVLRHQGTIAGIGNAYSDELLHAARMSPFKPANASTTPSCRRCTTRSAPSSATPSTARAGWRRAS